MTEPRSAALPSPRPSVAEMQRRLASELSLGQRVLSTLLLAVDLAVGIAVGSLWLTEPALPPRTRIAFAAIVAVAAVWAAALGWTLTRRKVLLARHRLVTSRIAVAASALFSAGALAIALADPELCTAGLAAGTLGALLLVVAVLLWRRAARRYRRLAERVRHLEDEASLS